MHGFELVAATLNSQGGHYADRSQHQWPEAEAEQAVDQGQRRHDEQRYGDHMQDQVGRVLVIVGVGTPLPGVQVGKSFAHGQLLQGMAAV
ncbi:hypothetical protein D3C76_1517060 [compost metagenome]